MTPPAVAVFDVDETLSGLRGLEARLEDVGACAALLSEWFAATLRDAFALTAASGYADFASIAVPMLARSGTSDAYAAEQCGADRGELRLSAVHPWDIDGARRAALRTGWIARDGATYPSFPQPPEIVGADPPAIVAAMLEER